MHIFIDESGTFTHATSEDSVSAVGALVIPDGQLATIEEQYAAFRVHLPKENSEVKGRLLSEHHVETVVSMLLRHDVLFEVTAVDLWMHQPSDIAKHQALQGERLTANLTDEHHQNLRKAVIDLRARVEKMTPQLFVQSAATFSLIENVIQHATLFYCQRLPSELGVFKWVIDGKDKQKVTDWERWWSLIVKPALQSRSFRKPLVCIREGDYSHFDRFRTTIGDYLKPYVPEGEAIDVGKIMTESFRFSGVPEPGLELVDILVNATRRALVGNLALSGWANIRRLMIHRSAHYIQMVALLETAPPSRSYPYWPVLRHFSGGGKNMFAKRRSSP